MSIITNVFFERKIPDLTIVPIAISYEKMMEGNMYANELQGGGKVKESLKALLGYVFDHEYLLYICWAQNII
jgi:glycerol-3-phosphate O-acyltransferase